METPTSEEKPRKQLKSALHQEFSEFNLSGQTSMDQLIKLVLNLQEEVKKLRKEKESQLNRSSTGQKRLQISECQIKRELETLWKYQRELLIHTNSQVQKIQEQINQIESTIQSQKNSQTQQNQPDQMIIIDKIEIENTPLAMKQTQKTQIVKKMCYYCKSQFHLQKKLLRVQKVKEQLWRKQIQQKIRKRKNQILFNENGTVWKNFQINQEQIMIREGELDGQDTRDLELVKNQPSNFQTFTQEI